MDYLAVLLYRLPVWTLELVEGPKWLYSYWPLAGSSTGVLESKPVFLSLFHVGLSTWLLGFTYSMVAGFQEGIFYEDKSKCIGTNHSLPKLITWLRLESV